MKNKQNKNLRGFFVLTVLCALIAFLWLVKTVNEEKNDEGFTSSTFLKIYNRSDSAVKVFITLGTTPGCMDSVINIPFVTDTVPGQRGLQGYFVLQPKDSTIAYAPDTMGFNGVISFNYAPDNCPSPNYPNGINQFEFILNNSFQGRNAQETIDISCVHGANCVIRTDVEGMHTWNAGPTIPEVQSFANSLDKNRTGIAGVYPYGCDTCTGSKTPPSCIKLPQPAQKASICNVQRNALLSGGIVKVMYFGKIHILE